MPLNEPATPATTTPTDQPADATTEAGDVPAGPPVHPIIRFWRSIRSLIILIVVLFAVRSSVADWNDVPTGSMIPTILEGDRIFVNKLAYDLKVPFTTWHIATWGRPNRGDVVVFFSPEPEGTRLVKRCVGLPGDTILVRNNRLFINGVEYPWSPIDPAQFKYLSATDKASFDYFDESLGSHNHPVRVSRFAPNPHADYGPRKLGDGTNGTVEEYFMMGDNRDNSKDSRYFTNNGVYSGEPVFVHRDAIVGKATAVAISIDFKNNWKPRWSRFFSKLP